MSQVFLHPRHHRRKIDARQGVLSTFNSCMYLVALISPVMTVPQFVLVWAHRQTAGLSLATWSAYTLASLLWLAYGLMQRQKPLVLSQALLLVLDFSIVLGVVLHRR